MSQALESKALNEFTKVLHNKITRKQYLYHLNKYLTWSGLESYDGLVSRSIEEIQTSLENYCASLQDDGHKRGYLKLSFASLTLFFGMNNKIINKVRISKMIQPQEEGIGGDAYTTEDVQKILKAIDITKNKIHTKPRTKALVHFLASTGCRLGAIPLVRIRDLEKIENCYSVKIYNGHAEEYNTFLTPEASRALNQYLKDPIFTKYDEIYTRHFPTKEEVLSWEDRHVFPLNYDGVRTLINRLVRKAGLDQTKTGERYDKPLNHAFRKRWNTILKSNNDINSNLIELMLGHSLTYKLDKHYLKPTKEKLFLEFQKGIDDLTINKDVGSSVI